MLIPHYFRKWKKGVTRSSQKSKSLWSMRVGISRLQGPLHASCSARECEQLISVSFMPCTKKVGEVTPGILSMFWKRSCIKYFRIEPA